MRFVADGPNIPGDLLTAQDSGRVVFFCGSGVSRASAGLPDFLGLVEKVLDFLKVDSGCEAKRLFDSVQALDASPEVKALLSADRLFTLLRRDFDAHEINEAVARCLKPGSGAPLEAHKIMLRLARRTNGGVRLVTTNFDRLFEQCDSSLKSKTWTRARLPRLEFVGEEWGVVHLHGRVMEDYSGADSDGFVLSSAEFGDAYLAQGWARDFVKRILETYVAVFVGYSADDPPMRYLLEGLQQTNSAGRRIYAFQEGPEDRAIAQWGEKGVTAIAFDASEGYSTLWKTMEAWARRSSDPQRWRKSVFALARKGPENLNPHERGMLAHVVSTREGALALRNATPRIAATWLGVFDRRIRFDRPHRTYNPERPDELIDPYEHYHIDDDPAPEDPDDARGINRRVPEDAWDAFAINPADRHISSDSQLATTRGRTAAYPASLTPRLSALAEWVGRMAHAPATVWWAARQANLHPEILSFVRRRIYRDDLEPIPPAVRRAWRYVFQVFQDNDVDTFEAYEFERQVRQDGWSPSAVRRYGESFRPRYQLRSLYRASIAPRGKARLHELINIEVSYPEQLNHIVIPDEALAGIVEQLRRNLEVAIDLEEERGDRLQLCAIEPNEVAEGTEFARSYKMSGFALHFIQLFKRLIQSDVAAARGEFSQWRRTDRVFARIRFWAAGIRELASPDVFADEIDGLSHDAFWDAHNERDLLIVLVRRWRELPDARRKRIEERLTTGPPRSRRSSKEENALSSAVARLNRLFWLSQQGCTFSFDVGSQIAAHRLKAPDWLEEYGARAAESLDGRSGTVTTVKDWSDLADVPLGDVLRIARERSGKRRLGDFERHAPFTGLCEARPRWAFSALSLALKRGDFDEEFWHAFLTNDKRRKDTPRLKRIIAGRVAQLNTGHLCKILLTAARWFEREGPQLLTWSPDLYRRVWRRMIEAIRDCEREARSAVIRHEGDNDLVMEAINSPAGCLAELFTSDPQKDRFTPEAGFTAEALARADKLLGLPAPSRQYTLTILGLHFAWLQYLHPDWVGTGLLPSLEHQDLDSIDSRAVWAGLLFSERAPSPTVFTRLKPRLLALAQRLSRDRRQGTESLAGFVLAGWGSKDVGGARLVSDDELRTTLLRSDDEFRCKVLWLLRQWSREPDGKWADAGVELLRDVWPRNKKARTPKVSADLCELAFAQKKDFAAMASAAAKLVGRISDDDHLMLDDHDEEGKEQKRAFPNETIELLYAILPEDARRWPYGTAQLLSDLAALELKPESRHKLAELQFRISDL